MAIKRMLLGIGSVGAGLGLAKLVQLWRAHQDRPLPYRPGDWPPVPAAGIREAKEAQDAVEAKLRSS